MKLSAADWARADERLSGYFSGAKSRLEDAKDREARARRELDDARVAVERRRAVLDDATARVMEFRRSRSDPTKGR